MVECSQVGCNNAEIDELEDFFKCFDTDENKELVDSLKSAFLALEIPPS